MLQPGTLVQVQSDFPYPATIVQAIDDAQQGQFYLVRPHTNCSSPVIKATDVTPLAAPGNGELAALEHMFQLQQQLERRYGHTFPQTKQDTSETIRNAVLALTDELHEALHEVNWKPWTSLEGLKQRDAYKDELVDCLHFFIVLCLAGGVTPKDLYLGYLTKNAQNGQRQRTGYDDVHGKCRKCHADQERVKVTDACPRGGLHEWPDHEHI